MKIDLIDDSPAFDALESEWTELAAASSADSPFLSWEWLNPWWKHLGAGRRLAILVVRDGHQVIGIAPLSVARSRLPWFWRWEFLGTGFAGSDYLDVIARRGRETDTLDTIARFMRARKLSLHLDHLRPASLLARLTPPLTAAGWVAREVNHGVCPFIRLAGHTWDSFLATVGPAHRATTRRRLRTLERDFAMRFELVTTEPRRCEVLERLFAFHEDRWGRRGTAFRSESLRAFHHEATAHALSSGWLRLYAMYLNDDLAAAMYGFSFKNRFYFYQHGFDDRYRPQGAGRAVLDLAIRAAIGEGLIEFDLLYGDEAYKRAWTQETRSLTRIDLFPPHLTGRIHRRTVEAERSMRLFGRRILSFNAHAPQTS